MVDFDSIEMIRVCMYTLAALIIGNSPLWNGAYRFVGFEENGGSNSAHAWEDGFIIGLRVRSA